MTPAVKRPHLTSICGPLLQEHIRLSSLAAISVKRSTALDMASSCWRALDKHFKNSYTRHTSLSHPPTVLANDATTILLPCGPSLLQATSGASLAIEGTDGYARVRPEEAGVLVFLSTTLSYSSTLTTDPIPPPLTFTSGTGRRASFVTASHGSPL